jgi:hypothetical protein
MLEIYTTILLSKPNNGRISAPQAQKKWHWALDMSEIKQKKKNLSAKKKLSDDIWSLCT